MERAKKHEMVETRDEITTQISINYISIWKIIDRKKERIDTTAIGREKMSGKWKDLC
jgi:hypothetical protein